MLPENIRRGTSGKKFLAVMIDYSACDEACTWIEGEIRKKPNITAQGLWDRCPNPDWLSWVIELIGDEDDNFDFFESVKSKFTNYCCADCDPEDGKLVVKEILRRYESPWLP